MTQEAKTTTNHDEIRKWVEARNGVPATVASTGDDDEPGILRILFQEQDSATRWRKSPGMNSSRNSRKSVSLSCIRTRPSRARPAVFSSSSTGTE